MSFAGLVSALLRRLLCNLERVSVSCSGTAALWHGLSMYWVMMSPNLQYQSRVQETPLCRARPHAQVQCRYAKRCRSTPSCTCSAIRVLSIRDMLSHVRRRGHLTLRGITISVGGRLVTLALALLVSRQGFRSSQPRAHGGSGDYMQIAGVVQDIVNRNARSHCVWRGYGSKIP